MNVSYTLNYNCTKSIFSPCLYIGFVTRIYEEKRNQLEACSAGSSDELLAKLTGPQKPVVGVIGDQSSDITIQVNNFL